jgi:hypothetical protein
MQDIWAIKEVIMRSKPIVLAFGIALFLSGCLALGTSETPILQVLRTDLEGGFRPNETLVDSRYLGLSRQGIITETGDTYSYSFGDGDITGNSNTRRGAWMVGCSTDRMTSRVNCRTNLKPAPIEGVRFASLGGGLQINVNNAGSITRACVFGHDFPGRNAMIRVDENSAITTNSSGCVSGGSATRLQRQLLIGTTLTTRRIEWPYDSRRDQVIEISGGFSNARELFLFTRQPKTRILLENTIN